MNVLTDVKAVVARLLRGPRVSRLLVSLGIEPRRFWLLCDLFGALSDRGEMMDQLGRNGVGLKGAALLYLVIASLLSLAQLATGVDVWRYFGTFIGMTAFLLVTVLLSETGNSLVNPTEGLILAHQPVNGATYTAAKLTHLARIILYLVPALNGIPAVLGIFVKGARWFYPLLHIPVSLVVGLVAALMCCAAYGWLIRFIPANRLKAAGQLAGTIPFLFFAFSGSVMKAISRLRMPAWIPASDEARWAAAIVAGLASCIVVALGLRSLSADYLIRVSSLTRGGSSAGAGLRRSLIGSVIERFFGGQAGRAGFAFVSRMMLRDWHFRRQLFPLVIPLVVFIAPAATKGRPANPFTGEFTWIHVVPHVFGILLFFVCQMLHWGADYKGAWIFHLAPSRTFFNFARGVHGLLWIVILLIPHTLVLALLTWAWGFQASALFTAYSIAISSVYAGLELRLIDGVPFSRQLDTAAGATMFPLMMLGGFVISIVVAFQHFLLFRSTAAVAAFTVAAGFAAFYVTRSSLRAFELTMRHNLSLQSVASGTLYREVNT